MIRTIAIRSPMAQGSNHPVQNVAGKLATLQTNNTGNSAHLYWRRRKPPAAFWVYYESLSRESGARSPSGPSRANRDSIVYGERLLAFLACINASAEPVGQHDHVGFDKHSAGIDR